MLAAGIIAELQEEYYGDVSSSVLASSAIICIINESILFQLLVYILGAVEALVSLVEPALLSTGDIKWSYEINYCIIYMTACIYFSTVCTAAWHRTIS